MALIELEHVSALRGGVRALDDLTLSIDEGASLGLVGPNGAGKSTLLRVLAGLTRPSDGRALVDGILVNIDGRYRGASGGGPALGEVSLYNWQLAEWEDRIVGFGRNLVKDASPYVSATGDVRVRYTFKPPPDSGLTGVSFSRFDVTASGFMR